MFLDFIEVGTSDFDTMLQSAGPEEHGLSVDPMKVYLDRLPDKPNCQKVEAAVSDSDGEVDVWFIDPVDLEKEQLPNWLRGCNSIGQPHPTAVRELAKRGKEGLMQNRTVTQRSLESIMDEFAVDRFFHLKTDTEGHDTVILHSFFDGAAKDRWPLQLEFETNSLDQVRASQKLIARLIGLGYDLITSRTDGGSSTTLMRLNLKFAESDAKFHETRPGYYIMNYPEGYKPRNPPHENTLEGAQAYCKSCGAAGVTFQNGRYEVRSGPYLRKQAKTKIVSWYRI